MFFSRSKQSNNLKLLVLFFPILCKTYDAYKTYELYPDVKFIFQLYRRDLIKERVELLHSYGIPRERFATFIHHSAYVAKSAKVGYGCALMANVVVNSNACIGDCTTLMSNSLVEHDTFLGQYNYVAAHTAIGSNVHIGNGNRIHLPHLLKPYILEPLSFVLKAFPMYLLYYTVLCCTFKILIFLAHNHVKNILKSFVLFKQIIYMYPTIGRVIPPLNVLLLLHLHFLPDFHIPFHSSPIPLSN